MNPAERLLERLIKVAQQQIEVAKQLDPVRLEELTGERRDLLFELELEKENNNINVSPKLKELKEKLDVLDNRLIVILATVNKAMEGLKTSEAIKTYGANGRMKR